MKTTFLTLATIAAVVLGIENTTLAATKNNAAAKEISTTLNNVNNINKIEVHGNVQLFVSDGTSDQIKVYNRYYAEDALVQNKNGVLNIASYSSQKLVVWITAKELQSITAYDNAEVKSFGKLSAIDLDVKLHNSASAQLNLDVYNANVTVTDHAKINLSGTATAFNLNHTVATSVNKYNLVADKYTENNKTVAATKSTELAGL